MSEEQTYEDVDSEASTPDGGGVEERPLIDPEEFQRLREENERLQAMQENTRRMMDPGTSNSYKKEAARELLLDQGFNAEDVEEWIQVYDENFSAPDQEDDVVTAGEEFNIEDAAARQKAAELEEQLNQIRARNLKESMEKQISSAMDSHNDLKVLKEWLNSTRSSEDLSPVFGNISENVRQSALENLRTKRNAEGRFDESWLEEAVNKAAAKVAKDMLTVIGDTSKIGRVSETAGQTETLSRRKPVELPDNKGKSFGEVEGQLRDWTTDQILRSLSDPGGDSKA